jgi:hypothetical protein
MSEEKELEKIIKKLENNADFMEKYDVTKPYSYEYFIRVTPKKKSMDQQLIYSPFVSVSDNYRDDFCFEIHYNMGYITKGEIMVLVSRYDYIYKEWLAGFSYIPTNSSGPTKCKAPLPYCQTTIFGEVDVAAITKYIENTHLNIVNKRSFEETYVTSNSQLCENCKHCTCRKK